MKKLLRILFFLLLAFCPTVWLLGFHFASSKTPVIVVWILLLLLGILVFLSVRSKRKQLLTGILFSITLLLYIPIIGWYGFWLVKGTEGSLNKQSCDFCQKNIVTYFHQGPWGGTPYQTSCIGESYLGGFLYTTIKDTTYFAELPFASEIDTNIVLPENTYSKDLIFIWKSEEIVIIHKRKKDDLCIPLKYK